jgi:uncharacterized protein (DUF697 family)
VPGLTFSLGTLRALTKELAVTASDTRPIVVDGMLADVLCKELVRGGDAAAVRVGAPEDAAVYVHVLGEHVREEDETALKRARRAHVPLVALGGGDERVPYVLATDVVPLPAGAGFPIAEVTAVIARKLGEEGTALAARLPVLRPEVCEHLIRSFSRRNGILGAAIFVPGADLPVLTRNQLRLVLRIAAAYGEKVDAQRLPEIAATIGSGLALRALAREALDLVPVAGWALKGAVAYAGTLALGEAAVRYFELRASTQQQAAASRAAS